MSELERTLERVDKLGGHWFEPSYRWIDSNRLTMIDLPLHGEGVAPKAA